MTHTQTLRAAAFAAAVMLSLTAQAADADKPAADKSPAATAQDSAKPKPEAKPDATAKTPPVKAEKPNPAKDRNRHLHPRDGK